MEREFRRVDLTVLPDPLATKRASPFRSIGKDCLPVGQKRGFSPRRLFLAQVSAQKNDFIGGAEIALL